MNTPPTGWITVRRVVGATLLGGVLLLGAIGGANWWVLRSARPHIVGRSDQLPPSSVGLVLGTSPYLRGGAKNPFFEGRITMAAELFRIGQLQHLLVSGDNGSKDYDEPTAMKEALIARGVPAAAITLDHAGFRTLDTMARAKAVFGLQRVTVITDDFHQARAVFLARARGLDATGFPSGHVPFRWSKKTRLREIGSRVKACLDVYVLGTEPKFYGPPIAIPIAADVAP